MDYTESEIPPVWLGNSKSGSTEDFNLRDPPSICVQTPTAFSTIFIGKFRRGKLSEMGGKSHHRMANTRLWLHVNSFGLSSMELRRARPIKRPMGPCFENKLRRSPAGSLLRFSCRPTRITTSRLVGPLRICISGEAVATYTAPYLLSESAVRRSRQSSCTHQSR